MAINSYSTLVDAVGRWLYRDDLAATIPDFITLAEARINRDLKLRATETVQTGTLSASTIVLPDDLNAIQKLSISALSRDIDLAYKPPTTISQYSYMTGVPSFYTVINGKIQVIPQSDGDYPYTLNYQAQFPALTTTATNWLILNAPDVYLWGCLVEAAPFLQDDGRIPLWEAKYQAAIQAVTLQDGQQHYGLSSGMSMVAS